MEPTAVDTNLDALSSRLNQIRNSWLYYFDSANVVEHITCSRFLCAIDTQSIVMLHLNVCAHILALISFPWRQPFGEISIAL